MIDALHAVVLVAGVPLVVLGLLELAYYPLAFAAELRRRHDPVFETLLPSVSVIVPAYNEERVIAACVASIVADRYPRKEIIVVDDGSTDGTLAALRPFTHYADVTVITKANGGKAAALNAGLRYAGGEICCFVDADGIFTRDTITNLLRGFRGPEVGGVCGNDEPVNLDRPQTRLLALLTHGTALARRALALVGCLTVVSGNCGAFRRRVVDEVGGFREGSLGEDLELTWRVRAAGHRIAFQPGALVYAEVPATLTGLWRQRIRWTRGLVQTARLHRHLVGSRRHGRLGPYLVHNLVTMLAAPVLQLVALGAALALVAVGHSPVPASLPAVAVWLGLGVALVNVLVAVFLDRAWRDLRFLYVLPLVAAFSVFMSLVTATALWKEARGAPARWNKLDRTGVKTRTGDGHPTHKDVFTNR
ncbi:glycosyltransferase family 2 protein [Phytohabitans sp. ZYX-F-186]|uniref:Glycosyltransferase family 2 protein n=1 Tax=Phytohabitans maris TaxID=3071409 RepID=A0ABU0ZER3_9ACTN|nr:glycosyltransferase family 2 protein [Phytohabitans sp. ZYX-F-186]MDQ7904447.1 glycosyltransferase family 2 protein [Phytohabitans sp. ZYX-F-186]